ncbi:hypothetical protein FHK02_5437 [Spirosoma sp. LMG 31448]|uniref:Uncharacterized protein n=1 Tax=Spirosoma utsteinense TaxID=2585773 RepID=A0ABR6WE47_9BACT|nr:hypothetical protein [Spirosoma utsteinense]MBC3794811.1 hypothetical protein [Spirosoma utsteinense]
MIAYGSHNLSEASIKLRDYLMREKSSKRYTHEIGLDRLHYMLCEKWMNEKRKAKVTEYTEKAIKTVKALGLITKHEILPSKSSMGPKVVFHINKNWGDNLQVSD